MLREVLIYSHLPDKGLRKLARRVVFVPLPANGGLSKKVFDIFNPNFKDAKLRSQLIWNKRDCKNHIKILHGASGASCMVAVTRLI